MQYNFQYKDFFTNMIDPSGADSMSDLASVKTILNNTGSHKFNMFLKQSNEGEDDKMKTLRQHLLKRELQFDSSSRSSPQATVEDVTKHSVWPTACISDAS